MERHDFIKLKPGDYIMYNWGFETKIFLGLKFNYFTSHHTMTAANFDVICGDVVNKTLDLSSYVAMTKISKAELSLLKLSNLGETCEKI